MDFLKWITGESWIFLKINLFKEPKIFLTSSIRCLHTQKSNLVWYSLLKKKQTTKISVGYIFYGIKRFEKFVTYLTVLLAWILDVNDKPVNVPIHYRWKIFVTGFKIGF